MHIAMPNIAFVILAIWFLVWGIHVLVACNPIVRGALGILAIVVAIAALFFGR